MKSIQRISRNQRHHLRTLRFIKTTIRKIDLIFLKKENNEELEQYDIFFFLPREKARRPQVDKATCLICTDTYKEGDSVVFSRDKRCKEHFHEKCINKWVLKNFTSTCPYCTNRFDGKDNQKVAVNDCDSEPNVQTIDV
jgi:hypothetical protein